MKKIEQIWENNFRFQIGKSNKLNIQQYVRSIKR